jgi:hypothetical protein
MAAPLLSTAPMPQFLVKVSSLTNDCLCYCKMQWKQESGHRLRLLSARLCTCTSRSRMSSHFEQSCGEDRMLEETVIRHPELGPRGLSVTSAKAECVIAVARFLAHADLHHWRSSISSSAHDQRLAAMNLSFFFLFPLSRQRSLEKDTGFSRSHPHHPLGGI